MMNRRKILIFIVHRFFGLVSGARDGYHPRAMEPTPATLGDGGSPLPGHGESRLWLLPLCGLIGWHLWMTLGLFGADRPWDALLDDRPVVSGRHPLHLYHGPLGAPSFLRPGRLSGYDPAFQAGYPK